jgi:Zn-dependent peptidase ImmA (M78 family)
MVDLNNFPELSEQEIEMRVDNLLNGYADDSDWDYDMPVPIERIAENHLGYDIEITDEGLFADPDFLGGIHFDDKLIQVNGSIEDHDGRYSFTVAHELGHHCLHKDEFKKQTSGDEIMCRETGEKPIAELQADRFAAYLLMPSKMVLSAFNKAFGGDSGSFDMGYKNKYKLGAIAGSVIDAGGFSNVSITAMTNRLIGMNLITGVNYQSRVIPEIEIRSLKGLWKYYVSTFNKEVKRIKRYMK